MQHLSLKKLFFTFCAEDLLASFCVQCILICKIQYLFLPFFVAIGKKTLLAVKLIWRNLVTNPEIRFECAADFDSFGVI